MPRVLIVDDEPGIVMAVRDELSFEGFEVRSAPDGPSGLNTAREWRPDVLLLDLALPGMNGFEACQRLRAEMPELWIIILSVRSQEGDRVTGFERGADDYVTKPFSLRELVARVKVGLRRRQHRDARQRYAIGDLEIDLRARTVSKGGEAVELTRKEFEILEFLLEHSGEVITRDRFCDELWGEDIHVTPRVVDTHIASLRKKVENDPENPTWIQSVRGVGYKLDRGLTSTPMGE